VNPAISLSAVSHVFAAGEQSLHVLEEITLEVEPGELHAILGPSGCGKTTLLRIIAGLVDPSGGSVAVADDSRVATVFQKPRLLPWRTVSENIAFAAKGLATAPFDLEERVTEVMRLTQLTDAADQYPQQLSGGMAQRVAFARALLVEPDVLLLDEPFANLDALTAAQLRTEFTERWRDAARAGVLVTHDIMEAVSLADRVTVLAGSPASVSTTIRSADSGTDPAVVNELRSALGLEGQIPG
jgi:ABC-type nitrate/sulfonate/bicarbonate transport system ATPase subunit